MAPADAVISCIQSALDDSAAGMMRSKLRNLKTFVLLCTSKLGSNQNLASLLRWIEDVVGRKAFDPSEIESLEEEIHDWYITMFDYAPERDSASLLIHEASKLITSILETLADFTAIGWLNVQLEILREQMTFLKCLVEFAVLIGSESSNNCLIVHTEAVAMDAAYLLFTCKVEGFDEAKGREMEFKISSFVLKVQPVDLQTYEIYTQVLSSSKFSIQSIARDVDVIVAVRLLLVSLLPSLWRMLQSNASHLVPLMYQLQQLYGGLQYLSAVLDQKLSFDVKMKEDIVALVCDAGVLICSLYCHQTQVDLGIQNLLETVVFILAKFGVEYPRVTIFNSQRAYKFGFIDNLSKQLTELISFGAEPAAASCLRTIQEELLFLKHLFMDNVELCNELEELRAQRDHALDMAFKLKILTDHLEVGDLLYSSLPLFDSIMKDIESIKADVLKVFHDNIHRRPMVKTNEVNSLNWNHNERPLPRTSIMKIDIVARHEDINLLLDRLIRGSKRLRLIPVVGMSGIGKTTLATELYNARPIQYHFHIRACCQVSQVTDIKRVFLELLNQIAPQLEEFCEWTEEDLANKVRRSLKRRRYLIFLDDIWDIQTWDALKYSLPDDGTASRIILTSRLHHVTPGEETYMVPELSGEESLELLQRKLFPGSDGIPMILRNLAVRIVGICKGLPLAILLTAGFLATVEPNPDAWDKFRYGLSSRGIVSSSDVLRNILDLSYEYLPDYLKPCFLYFAAFQVDQEVPVQRLFRLWIAEGFVQKDLMESLEITAESYLGDLIGRELIMVAKSKSDGGVKTCRLHDLVHDLCLRKAKAEKFFHFLEGNDELSACNNQIDSWRLIVGSRPEHLKESKFFCPQVHSLILNSPQQTRRDEQGLFLDLSFLTCTLRFLYVLDIEQINVGHVFPSELEGLVQLAFLAIRGNMKQIPSSIDKLLNLETLILDAGTEIVALPDSLENLQSLQFLYVRSLRYSGGATLPATNFEVSPILLDLGTLCGVVVPSWGILGSLMRKFPNIRRLKCRRAVDYTEGVEKIVLPDWSRLESLHLLSVNSCHVELSLPENLKKLAVSGFHLNRENIFTIGRMPNLEVLKLLDASFEGNTWESEDGEFMKLRVLKLHSPGLVTWWTGSDEPFPSLVKFTLDGCTSLQEIPSSAFETSDTIEVMEVYKCSSTVVAIVREIVEVQRDFGNVVKLIVSGCES